MEGVSFRIDNRGEILGLLMGVNIRIDNRPINTTLFLIF